MIDRCERAYVAAAETATRRSSTVASAAKTAKAAPGGNTSPANADAEDVVQATPARKTAAKSTGTKTAGKSNATKKSAGSKTSKTPRKPAASGRTRRFTTCGARSTW